MILQDKLTTTADAHAIRQSAESHSPEEQVCIRELFADARDLSVRKGLHFDEALSRLLVERGYAESVEAALVVPVMPSEQVGGEGDTLTMSDDAQVRRRARGISYQEALQQLREERRTGVRPQLPFEVREASYDQLATWYLHRASLPGTWRAAFELFFKEVLYYRGKMDESMAIDAAKCHFKIAEEGAL